MGFGVPDFPDLSLDKIMVRSFKMTKGKKFNKKDVLPHLNRSSLIKEVIRRAMLLDLGCENSNNHPLFAN